MTLLDKLKHINIISGHYGCGKTTLSLNFAMALAKEGHKVVLADFDVVNTYFRSGDYKEELLKKGIEVIAPRFVNSNLDLPSIPAAMNSIFLKEDHTIIVDLGGDDAGAFAFGRFTDQLRQRTDYEFLYVVNCYRALTHTSNEAVSILKEIEHVLKLNATGLINNSHIQHLTAKEDILKGYSYAREVSDQLSLPVILTAVPGFLNLEELLFGQIPDLFSVKTLLNPF